MKINSKEFKTIINNSILVVDKKTSIPILKNINIKGYDNRIDFISSNLDEWYFKSLSLENSECFDILVNAAELQKVAKSLKNDEIEIKISKEDYKIMIKDKVTYKINIVALNSDDYPVLDKNWNSKYNVKINDKNSLFEIFNKIKFSTTEKNVNPSFSGILINPRNDYTDLVTTDIHRLSLVATKVIESNIDFVISIKTVENLTKIFKTTEIVDIKVDDEKRFMKLDNETESYCFKLTKNEFPDYYTGVLDTDSYDNNGCFSVSVPEFLEKVETIKNFFNDKVITTNFNFYDEKLTIKTFCDSESQIETEMNIDSRNRNGKNFEVGLNARYVFDALKILSKDMIKVKGSDNKHPILFFKYEEKYDIYHLIMPLRI